MTRCPALVSSALAGGLIAEIASPRATCLPTAPFVALSIVAPLDNPHTTGSGLAGTDLLVVGAWGVGDLLVALRRFSWLPLGR